MELDASSSYWKIISKGISYTVDERTAQRVMNEIDGLPGTVTRLIQFVDIFGGACRVPRDAITDFYESTPEIRERSWRFYQAMDKAEQDCRESTGLTW